MQALDAVHDTLTSSLLLATRDAKEGGGGGAGPGEEKHQADQAPLSLDALCRQVRAACTPRRHGTQQGNLDVCLVWGELLIAPRPGRTFWRPGNRLQQAFAAAPCCARCARPQSSSPCLLPREPYVGSTGPLLRGGLAGTFEWSFFGVPLRLSKRFYVAHKRRVLALAQCRVEWP